MKKKHTSELYASLTASNIESNSSDFDVLSLRISHRSWAMIQAFNTAFQRPVLTLFTDGISQHLADDLLESHGNESLILEEGTAEIQSDSALDLLRIAGAIRYDDSVIQKRFRGLVQKSEN